MGCWHCMITTRTMEKYQKPKSRMICPICEENYSSSEEVAYCMTVRHGIDFDTVMRRLTNVGLLHWEEMENVKGYIEGKKKV